MEGGRYNCLELATWELLGEWDQFGWIFLDLYFTFTFYYFSLPCFAYQPSGTLFFICQTVLGTQHSQRLPVPVLYYTVLCICIRVRGINLCVCVCMCREEERCREEKRFRWRYIGYIGTLWRLVLRVLSFSIYLSTASRWLMFI